LNILEAISFLDHQVPNPTEGLPEELFLYISRTTPLVNVDLLIKDEKGRTLLSWRNERYTGIGWHVPGGIIRFKEDLETRIRKVAESEIGTDVSFDPTPVAINQIINPGQAIRGHFISLLYKCFLSSTFVPHNRGLSRNANGYIAWHDSCPDPLFKFHEIYRDFIDRTHISRCLTHQVENTHEGT
jgi:ADP-ribose pyrophosphatase YjhB (NUDIX family)